MKAISFIFAVALGLWLTSCTPTTTSPYAPSGTSNVVTTIGTTTQYRASYGFSYGTPGNAPDQFTSLSGLLVMPDGSILFSVENGTIAQQARIKKLTPAGASFTVPAIVSNQNAGTIQRIRFINFADAACTVFYGMDIAPRLISFTVAGCLSNTWSPNNWGTSLALGDISGTGTGASLQSQNGGPGGVCRDNNGNWWIADLGNNRIQVYSNTNSVGVTNVLFQVINCFWVNSFGTFTTLSSPTSVRLDFNGNIAVVDQGNSRIVFLNPANGQVVNQFVGGGSSSNPLQLNRPMDIATNTKRQYLVTDFLNNRVVRFDSSGNIIESFGSYGIGAGQFNGPVGITIDQYDTMYIADQGNARIQVWSNVTTTTTYTNTQTVWQ